MTRRSVIILCAAFAAFSSRGADTNIPPSAIYGGGSQDGHAFTQRNTYTVPAVSIARFAGGSFDGHDSTRRIAYSVPAAAIIRFAGGSFDGHAYGERDVYIEPAAYRARFSGSYRDGYAFTERDTFNLAILSARFSGGGFDGSTVADIGPYPNPLNRDTNADGIPDWWIAPFFLNVFGPPAGADLDGDGWTTFEEYIADTDPRTAASRFAITSITAPGVPVIAFSSSSSNRLYTIEYSTNLPTNVWSPVPGAPQRPGIGGPDAFTDTANTNRANYRIRVNLP